MFVHGFACDHTDWQPQIDAMRDSHRCLRVDLRGHGHSADLGAPYDMQTLAADVVEAMRANHITSAVLVGHSMGTRVVAEALRAAPDLVRGLVFVDGSQLGHGDPDEARATINKIIDNLGYDHVMQVNFAAMCGETTAPALRDAIVQRASELPERIGRALWNEMVGYDAAHMAEAYAGIRAPLLVLQSSTVETGGQRRALKPGETNTPFLEMLTQLVPHAQLVLAPGIGHFIQLDAPDLVSQTVRDFAAQVFTA